jgi:hypothetical protein
MGCDIPAYRGITPHVFRHFQHQLKLPGAPGNWLTAAPKETNGAPLFSDIDNPGSWGDEYIYHAKFSRKGKKRYHWYNLINQQSRWKVLGGSMGVLI